MQQSRLDAQIELTIASDEDLAATSGIPRSVPKIGHVASTMLIADMPELSQISGEQAAALTVCASPENHVKLSSLPSPES